MLPRVISFFLALAFALAATLASGETVPAAASNARPALERVSDDAQLPDLGALQAEAETFVDMPDLLLGPLAANAAVATPPDLQAHAFDERAPPYLKGPLRPPCAAGLPA